MNKNNLTRAGVAGALLAVFGIVLFIVLWVLLGSAQVASLPRLFTSLCVPPAVIAAIIGAYILIKRPHK
ncbi:MAG: hypothetical protein LCI00_06255 [Chloroflexi bacterium]|nr:hypothetical protein [Chloroflexota bacterium]